ncbi:unnamed protein product [Ranitomeya imitator]|uniref:Uncharacterized protein n=1 Tax=Ranitomeya imitator TaxID=111125 RepID=A0ABN9LCB0_9NEOB|nr:unnamed protein product [Ranitomeya imitator]
MSGFSPELIDYLDGKISFEEFETRREERQAREKKDSSNLGFSENTECEIDDPNIPSTSAKLLSKSHDDIEDTGAVISWYRLLVLGVKALKSCKKC